MGKKESRQKNLKDHIIKMGFFPKNLKELAKKFKVSESTIRQDINEITIDLFWQLINQFKLKLVLRLDRTIPKFTKSQLVRLLACFVNKQEDKERTEPVLQVKLWNFSKGEEKSD